MNEFAGVPNNNEIEKMKFAPLLTVVRCLPNHELMTEFEDCLELLPEDSTGCNSQREGCTVT